MFGLPEDLGKSLKESALGLQLILAELKDLNKNVKEAVQVLKYIRDEQPRK